MATYYVDATTGSNSDDGLSEANAWQTVSKVNSSSFSAGDQVLFKRGEIWYDGALVVPSSGSSGNPITFGAYGSGADPIIDGIAVITSGWTYDTYGYYYPVTSTVVSQVWWNSATTRLTRVFTIGELATGKWFYDESVGSEKVWVYDNPSGVSVGLSYLRTLDITGKSYVTVQNIHFRHSVDFGILVYSNSDYVTISGCTSSYAYKNGVFVVTNCDNVTVSSCEVAYAGGTGIAVEKGSGSSTTNIQVNGNSVHNNCWCSDEDEPGEYYFTYTAGIRCVDLQGTTTSGMIIQNNEVYSNGVGSSGDRGWGIWCDGTDNTIVRYNKVHDNRLGGIYAEVCKTGCRIHYNLSYQNGVGVGLEAGICVEGRDSADNEQSDGVAIYNNVCWDNDPFGIRVNSQVDGTPHDDAVFNTLVKNNICYQNTYALYAYYGGDNNATYGTGNVYTHNCFGAEATAFLGWGYQTTKDTYDAWETSYGGSTYSVEANPQFVDATNKNFKLVYTSPCINAGTNVSLTVDYEGNTVPFPAGGIVDVGAYEYVQYPVAWSVLSIIQGRS